MTVASAGSLLVEVVDATIFQRVVPDAMRGRALGVIATVVDARLRGRLVRAAGPGRTRSASVRSSPRPASRSSSRRSWPLVAVGPAGTRSPDPEEALLRRVAGLPVFAGIAPARLEAILGRRRMRDVVAGEPILRQGDPADRFAVIVAGRFDVVARSSPAPRRRTHLRTHGPGRGVRRDRAAHGRAADGDRDRRDRRAAPGARGRRLPRARRGRAGLSSANRLLPRAPPRRPRRDRGRPARRVSRRT